MLEANPWRSRRAEAEEALRAIPQIEEKILVDLVSARESGDWKYFYALVVAAFDYPDVRYLPVLLEAYETEGTGMPPEDLIELIGEVGDDRAVPLLGRSLLCRPDTDEFGHFTRKAARALTDVGTPRAIEALRAGLDSSDPLVRRFTLEELEGISG
jgi:hypothetical protein